MWVIHWNVLVLEVYTLDDIRIRAHDSSETMTQRWGESRRNVARGVPRSHERVTNPAKMIVTITRNAKQCTLAMIAMVTDKNPVTIDNKVFEAYWETPNSGSSTRFRHS